MFHEGATPGTGRSSRASDAMKQLARGDDADASILGADERLDGCRLARSLPVDQEVGVDQDGQDGGLWLDRLDRRVARTSSAKRSSTGGAEASNVRNLSCEMSFAAGGAMTATGAPARVTSICSPDDTRFSTSENRRATSVALILVIVVERIR